MLIAVVRFNFSVDLLCDVVATYLRPGYTVQHCTQYCAQHFLLDVATRSQHFVQHYAQYLMSGCQDIGFL